MEYILPLSVIYGIIAGICEFITRKDDIFKD